MRNVDATNGGDVLSGLVPHTESRNVLWLTRAERGYRRRLRLLLQRESI
jgi:hypothetical protein